MMCSQLEELFGLYIYDELTAKERAEVDAHLETCQDCRSQLERFQKVGTHFSEAYRDIPDIDWDDNWRKIQQNMGTSESTANFGKEETRSEARSEARKSWPTYKWAGALAASIAIFAIGFLLGFNVSPPGPAIAGPGLQSKGFNLDALGNGKTDTGREYYVQEFQAHLENTKPVIIEYANYWKDAATSKVSLPPVEKELIIELLIQNQLLLCRIPSDNNRYMQQLLSELKTILTKIAALTLNDPESITTIKQMIRKKSLLFKMEALRPIDEGEVAL